MTNRGVRALLPVILSIFLIAPAWAQEQSRIFEPAQEEAIKQIIQEYILANPEFLIEAIRAYQARVQQVAEDAKRQVVAARRDDLVNDPDAPVLGNPDGDVTVVEFMDYRCPYCIGVAEPLLATVKADGNIRLVMKEFPILGPESAYAARMALAAARQGKYEKLHFAFMTTKGKVNKESARKMALKLGLDMAQLERDMESEEIEAMIKKNYELARSLGIRGTPSFVIGDNVIRGAMEMKDLRALVEQIRAESS